MASTDPTAAAAAPGGAIVTPAETNLLAVAENATVGISVIQDSDRVFANQTLAAMVGHTPQDLLARKPFHLVRDDLRESCIEAYLRCVAGDLPCGSMQTVLVGRDGCAIPVDCTLVKAQWDGRTAVIAYVRDIREQVSAREQRAKLEAHLREAEKLEAVGALAAGIAHDFSNVLSTIIGNVGLARSRLPPAHAAVDSLDQISKASHRARALVDQILAYGRNQLLEKRPLSLWQLVLEGVELLRPSMAADRRIETRLEEPMPPVMGDPVQLSQVVVNLVTQVLHLSEQRGDTVEVNCDVTLLDEHSARSLGGLRPGRYARLFIGERGMRPQAESLPSRPDALATLLSRRGAGLALSVVHDIVIAHGGAIELKRLDGGLAFVAYLPLQAEAGTHQRPRGPLNISRGPRQVLYLDGDESMVAQTVQLLKRAGRKSRGFSHPSEALAALRNAPAAFELAVVDNNLTDSSGVEFARSALAACATLRVVIASGFVSDRLREEAALAGVQTVIYKPDTPGELVAEVLRLMSPTEGGTAGGQPL